MMSRFLEKRIEVGGQEIPFNPGNALELEYYLIESEPAREDAGPGEKGYGIQIIKKENGVASESAIFRDIHHSRETAEKLVRLLADNTVTPVTLPYIIDDMLGC
jgi:hypothetical protein